MKNRLLLILLIAMLSLAACREPRPTKSDANTLTVRVESVVDAVTGQHIVADLWIDNKLIEQGRSEYTHTVTANEPHEIRLKAQGYYDWAVELNAHVKSNKVFSGIARMEPVVGNKSALLGALEAS